MLEDRELLANIGRIVVDAALLEYAVATLVATADGACAARTARLRRSNG